MSEYTEFLFKHWELSLLFLGILIALVLTELRKSGNNLSISTQEAINLFNHENAILIDLRDSDSYRVSHIVGSLNMPIQDLDLRLKKFNKSTKKIIVLICATGVEAQKNIIKFSEKGFETVKYLAGGLQSWRSEGLPLSSNSG